MHGSTSSCGAVGGSSPGTPAGIERDGLRWHNEYRQRIGVHGAGNGRRQDSAGGWHHKAIRLNSGDGVQKVDLEKRVKPATGLERPIEKNGHRARLLEGDRSWARRSVHAPVPYDRASCAHGRGKKWNNPVSASQRRGGHRNGNRALTAAGTMVTGIPTAVGKIIAQIAKFPGGLESVRQQNPSQYRMASAFHRKITNRRIMRPSPTR